ncbi:GNAT family protein [Burkholderia oklahomensis]|uniref:GNAT family N-acetyltransferase n=1 Tax=Burkholderia oklahomensis TaxID=342113 RepID=UPI002656FC73|nr:GNAT family protein [Burkholderia oklahomensis]MDN7672990.1 GNAT family protein [Burkholderia oklahomensis]
MSAQSNLLSFGNQMDSTAGRHDCLCARGSGHSNIKRYIRPLTMLPCNAAAPADGVPQNLPRRNIEMTRKPSAAIETARLVLDALDQRDAESLFDYRGNPEVWRYQGWRPASVADSRDFIARQSGVAFGEAGAWCQLAIRRKPTRELIGDLGVHFPASDTEPAEFGISLSPAHQRKGYAREVMTACIALAFRQWGHRRLVASVDPRNTASMALFRALGFRQEAHHVESYCLRGEWVDDVIFAMLAREWSARSDSDSDR